MGLLDQLDPWDHPVRLDPVASLDYLDCLGRTDFLATMGIRAELALKETKDRRDTRDLLDFPGREE